MSGVKYEEKLPNKYYDQKGDDGAYGKQTGYKYGQYKPGMIKDNGKPLKKNGRKKGTTLKSQIECSTDISKVANLLTFGVKKVTNKENIDNGVKAGVGLTVPQACLELGVNIASFYYYLNRYPALREEYNQLKENRREYLREVSENNISGALTGKMKSLKESEVVDYSFKMLERTDKNYNPKQIVETTVEEINPERTTEDIIGDIADLIK